MPNLDEIADTVRRVVMDAYNEGFRDGENKQAILELQARDKFIESIRDKYDPDMGAR